MSQLYRRATFNKNLPDNPVAELWGWYRGTPTWPFQHNGLFWNALTKKWRDWLPWPAHNLQVPARNQALRGVIWAITRRRLHSRVAMRERKEEEEKKKQFSHRGSWAHFEHIIVIWFVYSLITAQSDYRRGNKGRRMEREKKQKRRSMFMAATFPPSTLNCSAQVWL